MVPAKLLIAYHHEASLLLVELSLLKVRI